MHQERNPTTVSQLLTQIRYLQNKVNSLSAARELGAAAVQEGDARRCDDHHRCHSSATTRLCLRTLGVGLAALQQDLLVVSCERGPFSQPGRVHGQHFYLHVLGSRYGRERMIVEHHARRPGLVLHLTCHFGCSCSHGSRLLSNLTGGWRLEWNVLLLGQSDSTQRL